MNEDVLSDSNVTYDAHTDDKDMKDGWIINTEWNDIVHKHGNLFVLTYFTNKKGQMNKCAYCGESAPEKYVTLVNLLTLKI